MKTIHVPVPSLAPHGGVRVIVDIANWLAEQGYRVRLQPLSHPTREQASYWRFSPKLGIGPMGEMADRVLITSPHSIHMARPHRTVVHLQMLEHLFRPDDPAWYDLCKQTYQFPGRLLSISAWNIREMKREHPTSYIGNGIDFLSFPIQERPVKDLTPTVLVEGWNAYNPCKDVDRLAPQTARLLREAGVRVIAYGGGPMADHVADADEYHFRPSLKDLNRLYERAWVLLKASVYDARSCSPIEAMTKGTPTVRAIREGDDDLQYGAFPVWPYDIMTPEGMFSEVMGLLETECERDSLAQAGYAHLREHCDWDRWGRVIEEALRLPGYVGPLPGELELPPKDPDQFCYNPSSAFGV